MNEFESYRLLMSLIKTAAEPQQYIAALNKLRTTKKCVDCEILKGRNKELKKQIKPKRQGMTPFSIPDQNDDDEYDGKDFHRAVEFGMFATWRR